MTVATAHDFEAYLNVSQDTLPKPAFLTYGGMDMARLTHYLFRYPAKFHPPVVAELINKFSKKGDVLYDPFCGSGTLQLMASVMDRHAIGTDIDPLACLVAQAKTQIYDVEAVKDAAETWLSSLKKYERTESGYDRIKFSDVSENTFNRTIKAESLVVPDIPRLFHWFRRYVIIDLARIKLNLKSLEVSDNTRLLLKVVFGSVIRSVSNADPVPVSGLEVTSHMKRKDAEGRVINPYAVLRKHIKSALSALEEYSSARSKDVSIETFTADALSLSSVINTPIDAVITSPPYHNAVDYYRRHTLEMYWLDLTLSREDRLSLLPKYIGRDKVAKSNPVFKGRDLPIGLCQAWEERIMERSPSRAQAFRHYILSMRCVMEELSKVLVPGKRAIFVVGQSSWNSQQLPTVELFNEISREYFDVSEYYWYNISNRYMSYSRHNGANIDKEYVIVLTRNNKHVSNIR